METTPPRQAVIWGRFSSDKQADGDSRRRQEELNRDTAQRLNLDILGEYFDEGVSVKDGSTPKFKAMVASLKSGQGIVCENIDRISRDHPFLVGAEILSIIQRGIFIVTSQDGKEFNSDNKDEVGSILLQQVQQTLAYGENVKRRKRIKEGIENNLDLIRQGKPAQLGCWQPKWITFNADTKSFVINQERKATMLQIVKMYLEGNSYLTIAAYLNRNKVKPFKYGKRWYQGVIGKLLRTPFLIGTVTVNGEEFKNAVPAIISEETYFKILSRMNRNKNNRGKRNSENCWNLLRGISRCICGGPIRVTVQNAAENPRCYYVCDDQRNCPAYGKGGMFGRSEPIEDDFIRFLLPRAKEALLGGNKLVEAVEILKARKNAAETKLERTTALLDDDTISISSIKSRLVKEQNELKQIESELSQAEVEASSYSTTPDNLRKLNDLGRNVSMVSGDTESHLFHKQRKEFAEIIPSILKSVVMDFTNRKYPKFIVTLMDGKVLLFAYRGTEWEVDGKKMTGRTLIQWDVNSTEDDGKRTIDFANAKPVGGMIHS